MIAVEEAVDWVLQHRAGKVFRGQTAEQIEWAICRAIHAGGFTFAQDEEGRLVGVCCATPNKVEKTLRVHHILCIDRRALPSMVERFRRLFGGYTITAKRHGKDKVYRTERLVRLLSV